MAIRSPKKPGTGPLRHGHTRTPAAPYPSAWRGALVPPRPRGPRPAPDVADTLAVAAAAFGAAYAPAGPSVLRTASGDGVGVGVGDGEGEGEAEGEEEGDGEGDGLHARSSSTNTAGFAPWAERTPVLDTGVAWPGPGPASSGSALRAARSAGTLRQSPYPPQVIAPVPRRPQPPRPPSLAVHAQSPPPESPAIDPRPLQQPSSSWSALPPEYYPEPLSSARLHAERVQARSSAAATAPAPVPTLYLPHYSDSAVLPELPTFPHHRPPASAPEPQPPVPALLAAPAHPKCPPPATPPRPTLPQPGPSQSGLLAPPRAGPQQSPQYAQVTLPRGVPSQPQSAHFGVLFGANQPAPQPRRVTPRPVSDDQPARGRGRAPRGRGKARGRGRAAAQELLPPTAGPSRVRPSPTPFSPPQFPPAMNVNIRTAYPPTRTPTHMRQLLSPHRLPPAPPPTLPPRYPNPRNPTHPHTRTSASTSTNAGTGSGTSASPSTEFRSRWRARLSRRQRDSWVVVERGDLPDVPEVPKDEEAQHEYDVHGESRADADADTDSEDIETETAPRRGSIIDRVRAERAARTRSVDPDERMPDLEAELDALRARARAWARGMSV